MYITVFTFHFKNRNLLFKFFQGADFVEFDVQLSKDLIPVLFHDFRIRLAVQQVFKVYLYGWAICIWAVSTSAIPTSAVFQFSNFLLAFPHNGHIIIKIETA